MKLAKFEVAELTMPSKLKTNEELLSKRGLLAKGAEDQYQNLDFEQILTLLTSKTATDRTLAARLIGITRDVACIEPLITALTVEQKLYSKLGICKTLEAYGQESVLPLVQQLGKIGDNQHQDLSDEPFRKDSYPLPRDIAARTLVRMGLVAVPALLEALENGDVKRVSEAIDAIGFINFYETVPECYEHILTCYRLHKKHELIRWKCIRAMSGCAEAEDFLLELQKVETHPIMKFEIERSLRLASQNNVV